MTKFHKPNSCNKCKGETIFSNQIVDERQILYETNTKCTKCGFEDYWAYGFFESSVEIGSNCETYSFDE